MIDLKVKKNIMDLRTAEEFGLLHQIKPRNSVMLDISGRTWEVVGVIKSVIVNGAYLRWRSIAKIYVVKHYQHSIVLGTDWIKKNNIRFLIEDEGLTLIFYNAPIADGPFEIAECNTPPIQTSDIHTNNTPTSSPPEPSLELAVANLLAHHLQPFTPVHSLSAPNITLPLLPPLPQIDESTKHLRSNSFVDT